MSRNSFFLIGDMLSEQGGVMAHTPGPWTYEKGLGCKTISGQDYDIADTVGLDNERGGEDEANARLIAAAPDLMKALERAEQTIRNLGNAALTGDPKQIALNEAANLRADIAKARKEK